MQQKTGFIWARESNEYDKEIYSIKEQVLGCLEQAEKDGVLIPPENIFRVQFSGVDVFKIPELKILWQRLELNEDPKIVYAWVQDRMLRGKAASDIFYISTRCRQANTKLFLVKKQIELTAATIGQEVEILIDGHKASSEVADIVARTWTGRLGRMKEGKIPNSGPNKFGYRRIRLTGKAEIVPEEAAIIRRCADEIEQGRGLYTIAQQLNREGIPSPRKQSWFSMAICRFFLDPSYKGEGYGWRWSRKKSEGIVRARAKEDWIKLSEDAYPPIIEPKRWDRINRLMRNNKGIKARQERTFALLRGLLRCQACNYTVHFVRTKDRQGNPVYGYYQCARKDKEARSFQSRTCHARRRNAKELEQQVWATAESLVRNPSRLRSVLEGEQLEKTEGMTGEIESLEKANQTKLAELERLAGRLRTASDSIAEHIEHQMEIIAGERRGITTRITDLRRQQQDQQGREESLNSVLDLIALLAQDLTGLSNETKRKILEALPLRWNLEGGFSVEE